MEAEGAGVPAPAAENEEQPAEIAMRKQALALDMNRVKLTLWDI